jgi:hypothetical protein
MGRYSVLNADTQDLINCLLPALAADFHVKTALEIIPEDIRMRAWDCERRDHIKAKTENDPRNWGVQFLKDLKSIARLNGGNLGEFHERLRAKVDQHEARHPWCRLADIKEIKGEYEHPDRPEPQSEHESSISSIDSYLEELHEPEPPKGTKRGRKNHEIYETRIQLPRKRRLNKKQLVTGTNFAQRAVSVAPKTVQSTARRSTRTSAVRFASLQSATLQVVVLLGSLPPMKTRLTTQMAVLYTLALDLQSQTRRVLSLAPRLQTL